MENSNKIEELKCPSCGRDLKKIDIIYKQTVYDRFKVDIENKILTVDYGDVTDSDILRYECTNCGYILPERIVNIVEYFERD